MPKQVSGDLDYSVRGPIDTYFGTISTEDLLKCIDWAIHDFTSDRASMSIPPQRTDVDLVLGQCRLKIAALEDEVSTLRKAVK